MNYQQFQQSQLDGLFWEIKWIQAFIKQKISPLDWKRQKKVLSFTELPFPQELFSFISFHLT